VCGWRGRAHVSVADGERVRAAAGSVCVGSGRRARAGGERCWVKRMRAAAASAYGWRKTAACVELGTSAAVVKWWFLFFSFVERRRF
jgi:hypothetical protein